MRTRRHDYIDPKTQLIKYGIQVFHERKWKNAAEDLVPCIFDDPRERNMKMAEFRKLKLTPNATLSGGKTNQK